MLKPAIFKCGQCDYIAKAKQTLQVHEFHHKEKSQFQCGVCSYSVTSARVLSLHVKHHHSGQEAAPVSIKKVCLYLKKKTNFPCHSLNRTFPYR